MKAVIYARCSSDSQPEESIEDQMRECTAFAEINTSIENLLNSIQQSDCLLLLVLSGMDV